MPEELIIRFAAGGLLVSAFAALGDLFRPKTFAGVFGAAPSIALTTLGLIFISRGGDYASTEGRSMVVGAIGTMCYSALVGRVLLRGVRPTLLVTAAGLAAWFAVALGLAAIILGGSGS
jgi:hypothetical protein